MSGDREVMSEQSSLGREPKEDINWTLEREFFAHSPTKEEGRSVKRMRKGRKRVTRKRRKERKREKRRKMRKAKADIMAAFQVSQPIFDESGVFYGDGFDDCLKQVEVVYPDLDLS